MAEAFALTKLPVCAVLIQRVSRSDDAVNCDCICAAVNILPVMSALGCRRAAEKQQLHKTSPVLRMVRAVQLRDSTGTKSLHGNFLLKGHSHGAFQPLTINSKITAILGLLS